MKETFQLAVEVSTKEAVSGIQDITKELDKATAAARQAGQGMSNSFNSVNGIISNLKGNLSGLASGSISEITGSIGGLTSGLGGLAAVTVGAVAGFAAMSIALQFNTKAMLDEADAAAELADKYGITLTQLETFKLIAAENSGTVEGLVSVYDKLSKALSKQDDENLKVTNSFRRLGLAEEDLANLSKEQIAGKVIANYEALGRSVQATSAVMQILGSSFRDQIPAIKEAATGFDEYTRRVEYYGAVVTPAMVKAGGEQEKAFSNLGLAATGLKIVLAETFSSSAKDIADWSASLTKSLADAIRSFRDLRTGISLTQELAIELEARKEAGIFNIEAGMKLKNERMRAIAEQNRKLREEINAPLTPEPTKPGVKPLPDLEKDSSAVQSKLSEQQKAIIDIHKALFAATNEMARFGEQATSSLDPVTQKFLELKYKLYDAGKGFIDLATVTKIAAAELDKIKSSIQDQNTLMLRKNIDASNTSLSNQIEVLKAQTDIQKSIITMRQGMDKATGKEFGLQTADQVKMINAALADTEIKLAAIRDLKIGNSVTESLKDLTEQSMLLETQLSNFWQTNRDTLNSTASTLSSLYKQIDPEGRGKNITAAQKAQLEAVVAQIEAQKQLLELNKEIDDSFKSLGSAVSNWALGGTDAIAKVRVELLKLIALEGLKAIGGAGSGLLGSFVKGIVGGLSGKASGGHVKPGETVVVGENRPELFTAGSHGGYVTPKVTTAMLNTSTGAVHVSVSPNLIIQGSVTGQTELENMFEQYAQATANEVKNFVITQRGQNGILAR